MLRSQARWSYNEVIISAIEWQRALPRLVEAFIFVQNPHDAWRGTGWRDARDHARQLREAFVAHFAGRGADVAQTPVLRFNGSAGFEEV